MPHVINLDQITDILAASRPEPGITVRDVGPVRWVHFDPPRWWETDSFRVIDVKPADAVRIVHSCKPGPHLIRVVTTNPEGVIPGYEALGYKTVPEERLETLMARSLIGFVPVEERHLVQRVETDRQRRVFNSMIDPDDPHGQMSAEQLDDPTLRHYFVELDGLCVGYVKAIFPTRTAVIVEPLGTRAEYRRRGIATALMNRLHAEAAAAGAEQSIVSASPTGVPFYPTVGYGVVAYVQKFVPRDWNRADYAYFSR
jgi:GNAT superfamily N-acetyltransferase